MKNVSILAPLLLFSLQACNAPTTDVHLLFIGDSHSEGTFGNHFYELLREKISPNVDFWGVGGSDPSYWLDGTVGLMSYVERHPGVPDVWGEKQPTPRAVDLLAHYHPDIFLIEQGTNCLWKEDIAPCVDSARELASIVSSQVRVCVWIGPPRIGKTFPPPNTSESDIYNERIIRVRDNLKTAISQTSCHWIDSFDYTHYPDDVPGADAIHYDTAGPEGVQTARDWAEAVEADVARFQKDFLPR